MSAPSAQPTGPATCPGAHKNAQVHAHGRVLGRPGHVVAEAPGRIAAPRACVAQLPRAPPACVPRATSLRALPTPVSSFYSRAARLHRCRTPAPLPCACTRVVPCLSYVLYCNAMPSLQQPSGNNTPECIATQNFLAASPSATIH